MKNKDFHITVRRQLKHEAEQAIKDLEKRGFVIVFPLTELKRDGKTFTSDSFKRKIFVENTMVSCWVAKLKRG